MQNGCLELLNSFIDVVIRVNYLCAGLFDCRETSLPGCASLHYAQIQLGWRPPDVHLYPSSLMNDHSIPSWWLRMSSNAYLELLPTFKLLRPPPGAHNTSSATLCCSRDAYKVPSYPSCPSSVAAFSTGYFLSSVVMRRNEQIIILELSVVISCS